MTKRIRFTKLGHSVIKHTKHTTPVLVVSATSHEFNMLNSTSQTWCILYGISKLRLQLITIKGLFLLRFYSTKQSLQFLQLCLPSYSWAYWLYSESQKFKSQLCHSLARRHWANNSNSKHPWFHLKSQRRNSFIFGCFRIKCNPGYKVRNMMLGKQ